MEHSAARIELPLDAITASRLRSSERAAVLATSSAFFMIILDTSIVNLALPSIRAELGSTLVGLQWIVDGYALVFASLLLGAGSLADRYGARCVFMAGLSVFTLASALCGEAPTITLLQIARALQGIGAALMLPTSLAPPPNTGPSAIPSAPARRLLEREAGSGALAGAFLFQGHSHRRVGR